MSSRMPASSSNASANSATPRPWLGILFNCCRVYGRIYRNQDGSAYVGRCPSCGQQVRAGVGPGGTNRRMFETS